MNNKAFTTRHFETVERMLREGMVEGQMHTCLRDAGRLAGGMAAASKLTAQDLAALLTIAVQLSKNKREGAFKWLAAVEHGRGEPVADDRAPTPDGGFGWDDPIYIGNERKSVQPKPIQAEPIIDERWIEADEIPEPAPDWQTGDLIRYLEELFEPDENVGIVTEAWLQEDSKRWLPRKGFSDRTRAALVEELRANPNDLANVIGDPNPEAGAWIRVNPLDGQGVKDLNVTAYRHTLIEADSDELGKQLALIRALKLPCAAIVHSGKKSIHAIVKVTAATAEEYRARVDLLYKICEENGLKVDKANRNPSRLSRLPGVLRGGRPQYLIDVRCGLPSWEEWTAWVEETHDDLPEPEQLADVYFDLPPLAKELIPGVLRQGHKMRLTGPSKAGKSFALIELAIAIAEGRDWMGIQCQQGPVLYINLELDRPSALHRFKHVYDALGWTPETISAIEVWNLRGKAVPLDKLAPKLIRRATGKGFVAIIIDPIYKLQWGDENDAGDVAQFCHQLDRICSQLGASVIDAHHHSKGLQGQKNSIDRGSGSGVFGRDPDAVLDLIELQISEDRRAQLLDVLVTQTLTKFAGDNDLDLDLWPVQDRAPVQAALAAFQMAYNAHAQDAAAAVYAARVVSAQMSGWRMEGTLREFAPLKPVPFWFKHPVHIDDQWDLLKDAKADGEVAPWEADRQAREERKEAIELEKREALNEAIAAAGGPARATIMAVAAGLGLNDDTVRKQLKRHKDFTYLKGLIIQRTGGRNDE